MKTALIIPTYQAAAHIKPLFESIALQSLPPDAIVVIDSSSTDVTQEKLRPYSVMLHVIPKKQFNHGGTRQLALSLVDADIYIYLTQDAILENAATLAHIVKCFENPQVGAAYGRQLPHHHSGLLGAHLRHFNYPETSELRSMADIPRLGIKTCANSNSFAAYRKTALQAVGGFPDHLILGEDVYVAARMLMSNWKMAYCAEAQVRHSHDYTALQDLRRYFDVGVFHQRDAWLLTTFNSPNRLGNQYVKSELRWCVQHRAYALCIVSLWHSALKWLGYKLGQHHQKIPVRWRKKLSMHAFYWYT